MVPTENSQGGCNMFSIKWPWYEIKIWKGNLKNVVGVGEWPTPRITSRPVTQGVKGVLIYCLGGINRACDECFSKVW